MITLEQVKQAWAQQRDHKAMCFLQRGDIWRVAIRQPLTLQGYAPGEPIDMMRDALMYAAELYAVCNIECRHQGRAFLLVMWNDERGIPRHIDTMW